MRDSEIDWDRLQFLSKRFRLQYRMRQALQYLTRFDLEIPENVLAGLSPSHPLDLQRWEYELLTGVRRKSLRTQIAILWLGFRRYADPDAGIFPVVQLPTYLKRTWRADSLWSLPLMTVQKGARRLFLNPSD